MLQRARFARLHADRTQLRQVSAEISSIERERSAALRRAADLAVELQQLQRRQEVLASSVEEGGPAYSRDFFATCPEELLCYIFRQLTDEPDELWPMESFGSYNDDRAQLPFTLSAVCVRWRRVALACSALWTYIGLPKFEDDGFEEALDAQRARVDLLLFRSGASPLEILLPWSNLILGSESVDGLIPLNPLQATKLRAIFTAISCHVERWIRALLRTPRSCDRGMLHVLRGPTPALAELIIVCKHHDRWFGHPQGGYLPFTPRLKRLQLNNTGMLCSEVSAFPTLSYLELGVHVSHRHFTDFLKRCASTLVTLFIVMCPPDEDISTSRLTLPRLRTLHSYNTPYFISEHSSPLLVAPGLTDLILTHAALKRTMEPFLSIAASTVTSLTLEGNIAASHAEMLFVLANLTHFAMATADYSRPQSYTIEDDFFVELVGDRQGAVVWPKLRSISLPEGGTISSGNGDVNEDRGSGLLRLVTRRNAIERPGGEGRPCRLEEVILECDGVPAWLVAEVARLLSA